MAKEHEMLSLGGQAAAAAHSLGTPLSTIKVISKELNKSLGKNLDHRKDIELLISQVDRCENILKKLTIDPLVKDDFINQNLSLADYVNEIIIEDDGPGYPKDVINKIGEPYNKSQIKEYSTKSGLGLGIFIGKTLLEKNLANIIFRNSETRTGAEVNIAWNNKDLKRI